MYLCKIYDIIKSTKEKYSQLERKINIWKIQLSLFQLDDPTLSSMRDTLKAADLNNMTPMQAFDLLRDMKKELGI